MKGKRMYLWAREERKLFDHDSLQPGGCACAGGIMRALRCGMVTVHPVRVREGYEVSCGIISARVCSPCYPGPACVAESGP